MDEHVADDGESDAPSGPPDDACSGARSDTSGDARHGEERVRRIVRVRGRVQGVGFRMDAAAAARRLGVSGTVRNLLDGSVEAALEGPPAVVGSMIDHLRQGPSSARVEGIDVRREPPRGVDGFHITG